MLKKLLFMSKLAILLTWGLAVNSGEILKPDFNQKELDYTNQAGKKIYAELFGENTKPEYTGEKGDIAVRLNNCELSYPAGNLINLNNGTVSFWINPKNWGTQIWKQGEYKLIPLFVAGAENGNTWLSLYLVNTSEKSQINFSSWSETRAEVRAQAPLDKNLLKQNEWTYVTATWDAQHITLYMNGKQIATASYGLSSNRTTGKDQLLRFMPVAYGNIKYKLDTLLKNLIVRDDTLAEAAVKAEYETMTMDFSKLLQPAAAQVPCIKSETTIDGKLDQAEWANAAKIPLMKLNNTLQLDSTLPGWVLLKHDGENLYIAYQVENAAKTDTPAAANTFSKQIFGGDIVEFYCREPQNDVNKFYQFGIAPNNSYAVRLPDGSFSDIEFKHQTQTGSDYWTVELAIPLKHFGITKFSAQTKLAANFGLHRPCVERLGSLDRWVAWSAPKSEFYFRNMGTLELMPENQTCRIDSLGDLNYGNLDFKFSGKPEKDLKVELSISNAQGIPQVTKTFDSGFAELSETLKWTGTGILSIKAINKATGNVVYNYDSKILIKDPFTVAFLCHPDKKEFDIDIDIMGLKDKAAKSIAEGKVKLNVNLISEKNSKIYGKLETIIKDPVFHTKLCFEDMPQGSYKIVSTIDIEGQKFTRTVPFEKPDSTFTVDRKGLEKYVPAPWTAIKKDKKTINTRFHSYQFGDSLFPLKSYSQETLVQSGNMLSVGNGNTQDAFKAESERDLEISPERIITEGTMTANKLNVKLNWRREINYDGMIRYELKLTPASGTATLDKLSLTINIPNDAATYAITPDYTPSFHPEWNKAAAVEIATFPSAWLTGDKVGFCLFSDNDANWVYPTGNDPIKMIKNMNGSKIVANLICEPVELKSEVSYVLAMMATPGKTPRADTRKIHVMGKPLKEAQDSRFIRIRGWDHDRKKFWWSRWHVLTNLYNPEAAKKSIQELKQQGVECLPYSMGNAMPDSNPIFDYYGSSWRRSVNGKLLPKVEYMKDEDGTMFYGAVPVCPNNTGFADYMCYYTYKLLKDYDLIGLYLDFGGVSPSDAPYKNTELKDKLRPGRQIRSYNTFGLRDMYERLYKIIHTSNPNNIFWIHEWDRYHPATTSFADIIYPGEEFMHSIREDLRTYIKKTPLESWQSVYRSEVNGAAVQFLNQYRYYKDTISSPKYSNAEKRKFARDLLTMVLLHDIPMSDYFVAEVHQVMDQNKISEAEFAPYWRQQEITTGNDSVKISYYHWKNKPDILMIVGNLKDTAQSVNITSKSFNLSGIKATDELTGETIDLSQPVQLDDYSCRILKFKKP